jgi:hypothetical protein
VDDPRIPPSFVAVASVTFYCDTGEILDSDIVFNDPFYAFSTAPHSGDGTLDVQAVATHELGHFLGFDHTPALTRPVDAAPWHTLRDRRRTRTAEEPRRCQAGALLHG